MTPRKELFIKIKEALMTIPQLELVDFYRKQFDSEKDNYPSIWTAVLIRIGRIEYDTMTEHNQEGQTVVDVILYCKDGWMDQHNTTADPDHGFMEIDLQDAIVDKLQFLLGDQFKPLQQTEDDTEDVSAEGIMAFKSSFSTRIYRTINPQYTKRRIQITS